MFDSRYLNRCPLKRSLGGSPRSHGHNRHIVIRMCGNAFARSRDLQLGMYLESMTATENQVVIYRYHEAPAVA